jgi:transcriptional regulator with PAS, ATPase and Fis domain
MQRILSAAKRVAAGNTKVLITGESGVGKDVLARYIHAHSSRASAAFVALNCAGLSETLIESELFGHVRGSFTGAHRDKAGRLQLAHRGTVFLDEIGEMSPRMQALLLRFLESGEIQPVGSESLMVRSDVRVISATNRDLVTMVSDGRFREDLLYRIKVSHLHVPPLRERPEDIPALVEHAIRHTGAACTVTPEAMDVLSRYSWPGNVRELQNVVEHIASLLAEGSRVEVDDLPGPIVSRVLGGITPSRERRRQFADDIYESLVSGKYDFWNDVQTLYLNRDMTRHDLRAVIRRGLSATSGNYRALLRLFRLDAADYKRFLNFLAAHRCRVDFREFRGAAPQDTGPLVTHGEAADPRYME